MILSQKGQHLLERRDAGVAVFRIEPAAGIQFFQLFQRHLFYIAFSGCRAVHGLIMDDHDFTIFSQMDVQFNAVACNFQRFLKRLKRIFWSGSTTAPMRDDFSVCQSPQSFRSAPLRSF